MACSPTTTSGRWASRAARRSRPTRCSAPSPPRRRRTRIGTLVARVGLVPDAVLARRAAHPGRAVRRPADRRASAPATTRALPRTPPTASTSPRQPSGGPDSSKSSPCWSRTASRPGSAAARPATSVVARRTGATLNLWGALPPAVASARGGRHDELGRQPAGGCRRRIGAARGAARRRRDLGGALLAGFDRCRSSSPRTAAGLAVAP